MINNSSNVHQLQTYDSTLLKEVIHWYYENDNEAVIIVWNKQNEIVFASKQMEKYCLENVDDLIGKQWTLFLPEEQAIYINSHFETSYEQLHLSNVQLPESENTFEGIIDVIEMDKKYYYICKLNNNTYVNDLKKIILDAEKLMLASQLSAGLVHEIRNPLTSLKGFLQLVQAGVEQKEEYYKVMISEIEKLEKITSELLHMAKPYTDNKKDEYILEMIKAVVFMMNTQVDMREVHFKVDIEKDLICFCNASQIKQVLFNIVKNGAEAMDKSGTITINANKKGSNIIIEIRDNGTGMSDEVVRELNNPFFTTKSDGSGLGLMITHHIIEMHNGQLEVLSKKDNGTIFTIMLPISQSK